MRRFLLEDGEGSSYPRPKRQRPSSPSPPPPPPPPPEFPREEIALEEEDSDEEEEDDDDEDTSDESEEEDEEEVEEIVRPPPRPPQQQNNQMETVGLQLLQPRLYESPIFLEPTLVRPSRNGAIFVALSDPEVLDCPTCCETLTIPVFQVFVSCFCFFPLACHVLAFNDSLFTRAHVEYGKGLLAY
jgi:E3 ubiquitin-protein ligase SIAH1